MNTRPSWVRNVALTLFSLLFVAILIGAVSFGGNLLVWISHNPLWHFFYALIGGGVLLVLLIILFNLGCDNCSTDGDGQQCCGGFALLSPKTTHWGAKRFTE